MALLHKDLYPTSLTGERLREIRLAGPIRLYIGDYYVQIEEPQFVIRQPDGPVTARFNPARGEIPAGLDSLGTLFGMTVVEAIAHDDGSLVIDFANDFGITISGGTQYEPWNVTGPMGTLVSLPSGALTSFWNRGIEPETAAE
jgi:hypothetical protein